ncbi:MAG: hypothetical protein PHE25_00705 [Candidatus Gracilibacteria bacterium]|nr:hypothetical protein [Candidatus Gracilibacteria bacterium]
MNKYILAIIFILGNSLHIWFLKINDILKIPDSFAYLQMAHYFKNTSIGGFGNGWFGFLYSMPIALVGKIAENDILSAFIVNMALFNLFVLACYLIGKNYLKSEYNALFLILIFLSPILLNYNINILSENIYLPLFLILFIGILRYRDIPDFSGSIFLGLMLALLYFTRAEAFIYLGSIGLIILYLLLSGKITFGKAFFNYLTVIISFFIFISPYLFHLHSITGERGLTNKGSANLRQAELRGVSKMDDDGFEQAVGELTSDNHHLIAGFAGGLKYDKPEESQSFKYYLLNNPQKIIERIKENQIKLYTNNLPNLIIGNAFSLYKIEGNQIFYQNKLFLILLIIPFLLIFYSLIILIKNGDGYFVFSFASLFTVASLFFTLFFVLDRYFLVFLPIFIFLIVYSIEKLGTEISEFLENTKYILFSILFIGIYSLGTFSYYNTFKNEDTKYQVKKIAGEWIKQNDFRTNLKIMERFPVVTYYAGARERWLTPYTQKLSSLAEYARFNEINYLVVDSIDFKKYRPNLIFLLNNSNIKLPGFEKIKEFENAGEKVILYRIK